MSQEVPVLIYYIFLDLKNFEYVANPQPAIHFMFQIPFYVGRNSRFPYFCRLMFVLEAWLMFERLRVVLTFCLKLRSKVCNEVKVFIEQWGRFLMHEHRCGLE